MLLVCVLASWPAHVVEARVSPLTLITRQIQKPNMLIVLDTSGSMNGVPGAAFTYASEVGVDCDNGVNCRGWTATAGSCSASGRSCETNADCQTRYCKVGKGTCTSDVDCPTQGTCSKGKYVCKSDADCAPYEEGACSASGTRCNSTTSCTPRGNCAETAEGCSNPGKACKSGWCQHTSKSKVYCQSDKDCGASGKGNCAYGDTPKGGCTLDSECPTVKSCSTGETCTVNSNCPKITVGTCKYSKATCTTTADCKAGDVANDSYVDTCQIPTNTCSGNTNYCEVDYNKCIYSAGNTCTEVTNTCKPNSNVCNIPVINACLPPDTGDVCVKGTPASALKMCQIAQSLCSTNADCPAGDVCGNPTSRTVVAKRTLSKVIEQNYNVLNLGLTTFYQSGYYPYYSVSNPVPVTETIYLTAFQMGSCYSAVTGPKSVCNYNGNDYNLASGANSQYLVGDKKKTTTVDAAWCGDLCSIPNVGTGNYQGSRYTRTTTSGTATTTKKTFATYGGKSMVSGGLPYTYFTPLPNYYNGGAAPPIAAPDCSSNQCSAKCGARWDSGLSTFIDPNATDTDSALAANKMLSWMEKAANGGILTYGGTPSGCTLENNVTAAKESSVYHYMKTLKQSDSIACRQNFVLFITDGEANGPGDTECTKAACSAADPEAAGCTCKVVLAAWHLRKDLGVRTFVIGFSSDVAVGAARVINDNVAKAGGTDQGNDAKEPYAFVATNEADLLSSIQNAIYDAVAGSYSTAPATASSGTQLSGSVKSGKYALDSRVDFPSWEGHLLAYDITKAQPTLVWDANAELKKMDWHARKLYVGTKDGNVVKVSIDSKTGSVLNKDTLSALGLGSDGAEAEQIIQFTLSAPGAGNPAVLGALINSTPIDVGQPGDSPLPGGHAFFLNNKTRPNLIYVGSSDGMLHAFFADDTKVNGTIYPAGSEAFAFMPYSMFPAVTKIFVQKGQQANPTKHVFGLANSPKVKNLCVQNCGNADQAVWKTLLVMNEGFGGEHMFVLDITNPLGDSGFTEPPLMPVWHSSDLNLASSYAGSVGLTTSVPAFYFSKSDAMNDFRLVFGSGYKVNPQSTTQDRRIVSASASTGQILNVQTVAPGPACTQEFGMIADVATAKDFSKGEGGKLRAAYVGDTWGTLWRYDGSTTTKVAGWGCSHPLHFAPTVVQLDRDDPSNNAGVSYLVQVTNSALDNDTINFPASKMIIRREAKDQAGAATADTSFGSGGEIALTVGTSELCAVTDGKTGCKGLLPAHARPMATPLAILKKDGSGFIVLSTWYAQEMLGCGKGATWLAIHEIKGDTVSQLQGLKVADEPVTSPVVSGGRILVVGTNGTVDIAANIEATVSAGTSTPTQGVGSGIYRQLGWTELP